VPPRLAARLDAPRRAHLARRLRVRLTCTVRCTATTAATLRGVTRLLRRVPAATRHLRAGRPIALTLKLSRAQLAAVRRARHAVTLRLVTTVAGSDGRTARDRTTIRLRRR
jgi:hypothetical protein